MNLKWTKDLKEGEMKQMKADLVTARPVLEKLHALLEAEKLAVIAEMQSKTTFTLETSDFLLSKIGELNAIDTVKKLIKE